MYKKIYQPICDYEIIENEILIQNINNSPKAFVLKGVSKKIFESIVYGKSMNEIILSVENDDELHLTNSHNEVEQFIDKLIIHNIIEDIMVLDESRMFS